MTLLLYQAKKTWICFLPSSNTLRLSARARQDLKKITVYTEREWGKFQKDKYLALFNDAFARLLSAPDIGVQRSDIDDGLFAMPVQRHIIFFRAEAEVVDVLRVLHQSMDVARHLGPQD